MATGVILTLTGTPAAQAIVLDFEGIDNLNNYGGLTWKGFVAIDQDDPGFPSSNKFFEQSGFNNGIVGEGAAVRPSLTPGAAIEIASPEAFTLNRAHFTAAWREGLTILIEGLFEGERVYEIQFLASTTTAKLLQFQNAPVDQLKFFSFGGIDIDPKRQGFNRVQFLIDDFTLNESPNEPVPEPLTILGSFLALGLGVLMKRQDSHDSENRQD